MAEIIWFGFEFGFGFGIYCLANSLAALDVLELGRYFTRNLGHYDLAKEPELLYISRYIFQKTS